MSYNGITSAFQVDDRVSITLTRSKKETMWKRFKEWMCSNDDHWLKYDDENGGPFKHGSKMTCRWCGDKYVVDMLNNIGGGY